MSNIRVLYIADPPMLVCAAGIWVFVRLFTAAQPLSSLSMVSKLIHRSGSAVLAYTFRQAKHKPPPSCPNIGRLLHYGSPHVGERGSNMGVGEPLHSCLTPSIAFIDPKVDCQKLSRCLGQHLFVGNTLTATILSLNCPKLQHSYDRKYLTWLSKPTPKVPLVRKDS